MSPNATVVACLLTLGLAQPLAGQHPGVFYPPPPASSYRITSNIRYGVVDTTSLFMDVYRPANTGRASPVLVFHTMGTQRQNSQYTAWARIAASKGLVGVIADLRPSKATEDFRAALSHLTTRAQEYGIDTAAITAFGASSNGYAVFRAVQDSSEHRVHAVIVYYSGSDVAELRRDLPVLYIRAGLDRPFVNAGIDSLVARALLQNAPLTVINHPSGHHGFEGTDDDAITVDLVEQTIGFVKRVTTPEYRAALIAGIGFAAAAAHVTAGDFAAASRAYADLVAGKPDDAMLRLAYGVALLGDRQYAKACSELGTLRGKGLGPRDLGLPAAQACLKMGDQELAMSWLKSIPSRFLPARVKDDPAFAELRHRADFNALFENPRS